MAVSEVEICDELELASAPVRSLPQIRSNKARFTRQLREGPSVKEKLSIIKEATSGLETKMSKVNYESIAGDGTNDDHLENNIEVEIFLFKMSKYL
eukprot:CAMPEP_0197834534 /NCGR_PEP_ID=MMETSP1437-20131217/22707_1 /TAXON_ID=49252 ORGANISM="Eucampia antarctica, Strain CCMP1452" /NCGR_SAMPLE_ID=MMETSP1437 /ASSEMBLY_ACC=CAM_ASM_001096 /LENGTH=95 /DNA_ID=CAMNT_0043439275 /DNA_START=23 /DNA_END=307 /DNA_ORIENTATION=-